MAVQLEIPYETLIELVAQLPESQQQDLIRRLQLLQTPDSKHKSGMSDKFTLLRQAQITADVNEEPSIRRED